MSRHELRNILFARGPSFRQGRRVEAPSGNTDLAPTILRILSIEPGLAMDGRVLEESLASGDPAEPVVISEIHEAERAVPGSEGGTFRQEVGVSRVGETTYVDQGNALNS